MHRLILIVALSLALAPSAFAHALLRSADPRVGSTVAIAPKDLKLTFSESVEPAFCHVEVVDAHGRRVDAGTPVRDPADDKRLIVNLTPLAPGAYSVTWHATSTDTHKTQGTFGFTVAPAP